MELDVNDSEFNEMLKRERERDERIKEAEENDWDVSHFVSDKNNRDEWIKAYVSLGKLPPPRFMCSNWNDEY